MHNPSVVRFKLYDSLQLYIIFLFNGTKNIGILSIKNVYKIPGIKYVKIN